MTVLTMNAAEITRFDTLMRLDRGDIRTTDAMELLGLQRRQVYRLLDRLRREGAAGLVSRKRGRPSNRRYSDAFRAEVVALVRENYADFGPTLAREYLAERHGLGLSCEMLRQIMMEAGLWKDRAARRPRLYQPRYRRDCRGELVQVDGSKHWWFEDRGPRCTPLVFIDDATSELMHLEMVESESTFSYMRATRTYLERHGKGSGIPFDEREKVFRRFYRRDASRNTEGAGLGLALVAAIAALHQADCTIPDSAMGLCVRLTFHRSSAIDQVTDAPKHHGLP
ncbi:helix-turn-helix domain-containing protein [Sphingomonas sanguinis]|uniref:helix-turn-helix domain-containing protein n=1 Tax=Sphingomonas sanguinis TaxID=33051 RepID=UPI000A8D1B98|nr:helix-turn-helix domain-containing protein [Sphingomonas sanguinis]